MITLARVSLGACVAVLAAVSTVDLSGREVVGAGGNKSEAQQAVPASAAIAEVPDAQALLQQYCVTCHNGRLRTAGLELDALDVSHIGTDAAIWEKVARKVRSGAMPPIGRRRPDPPVMEAFASWLETELDREAREHPSPGRPADHRLNRFEYGNAIRDLLALEIDPSTLLPPDESDQGFDNIAEVLSMSPTLLGRYLVAAQKISRLAVGDLTIGPSIETFDVSRGFRQDDRMSEALPIGTRGGMVVQHYFPLDGDYVVKVRLGRNFTNSQIRAIRTREEVDVLLDGVRIARFEIGGECADSENPRCTGSGIYRTSPYQLTADEALEVRFPASAGLHSLGVAFVKKSVLTEGPPPALLPPRHTSSTYEAPRMDVDTVRLEGPFNPTGTGDTPSRKRIFVCRPLVDDHASETSCATEILTGLARRAYRRPVSEGDVSALLEFFESGRREGGGFDRGIQEALTRLLVSPQFLFRLERDPANVASGEVYRIRDIELASRLSFFLWSSIPDDELLDLAEEGRLSEPEVLSSQVDRMLVDPRASALPKNFGGQWLFIRNLAAVDPDASAFPEFDDNLRAAFQRETELFLEHQMREDRPLAELLTADYTFANERLARFYGLRNVYGSHFRPVELTGTQRAGLLGQGSILTVTSYATRTSPVVRGKFLLDNILGAPPPPPPPNVPALEETGAAGTDASMRKLMEQHRQNPACAACHTRMDPLGFALENFDGIGQWRTVDGANEIDASGVLPDGTTFGGLAEFRSALLARQGDFVRTFTEKLLTYGLGRSIQAPDLAIVRGILREASSTEYRWSALIRGIVQSQPFQMRQARQFDGVTAP